MPFVKQCSSNHLPQRWAQARAEQGNAATGIGPIASSFMLSLEGKVSGRQRIGQGHRLESVDPWRGSTFPWRGKVKQTKIAESSSRWFFPGGGGSPPEHKLKGRAAFGYKQLGCPLSDAAAHERIFSSSLVERKVEISVLGLIDAMGVLPVANFITVLFTVQTNYSS